MIEQIRNELAQVTDLKGILEVFDKYAPRMKTSKVKGKKARAEINRKAKEILAQYEANPESISEKDRQLLRQYTGLGGIGGTTNEFYTPEWLAAGTWEMMKAYGFNSGNVLEPSAGVGVFADTKPKGMVMTSVEMDATSGAINQILHPDDKVIISPFEKFATNQNASGYDAVIGNPPYGPRGKSQNDDQEYKSIKLADQYFVTRAIDKVKAGGLVALVLPTRIVEQASLRQWRVQLAMKAEFLGAHRLPSGVFKESGTDVVTDVVIWRKHSEDAAERIASADYETLKAANVLWDTWISGKWFKEDGKRFIHGEESTQGEGRFARKVVDRGNRSNEQIATALGKRFDSRIDWTLLDTIEPNVPVYSDGDTRFINGVQMQYNDGIWLPTEQDRKASIDPAIYGVDNYADLYRATSDADAALSMDFGHLKAIFRDHPPFSYDYNPVIEAWDAAKELPERMQERVFRGILIGQKVEQMKDLANDLVMHNGNLQTLNSMRKDVGPLIQREFEKYGVPSRLKGTSRLKGKAQGYWQQFASAINPDGELSDLFSLKVRRKKTKLFDEKSASSFLAHLYNEEGVTAISPQDFIARHADVDGSPYANMTSDQLIDALAGDPDIAIDIDGTISQMHRATSGEIAQKLARLQSALANTKSIVIASNIQRQIETINAKRKHTPISEVRMKLTDRWMDKQAILDFLHERGYEHFVYGRVETDENGDEYFNDAYRGPDGYFTGYRTRDGMKRNNANEALERQIESHLNRTSIRGGSGAEGKAAVRETIRRLDEDFALWAAASDYSDALEAQYNALFNGYIEPEPDGRDLQLNGISGSVVLKGYQNAEIRKKSDLGCGIISFGTGLGKTFTALGLVAHNLEVGRSHRTAIIVPKSVLENWYHESDLFFGSDNLGDKVFVGIEAAKDKDGNVIREAVLDDNGNPRKDAKGNPITRAKITIDTSAQKAAKTLHEVAQSSKCKVLVMTKDVYEAIPLKEKTISDNVSTMVEAGLVAGSNKFVAIATKYREQAKNDRFKAKYSDAGGQKKNALPYFEDLFIDNVVVDEGHDFRNSYKIGSYGNRLQYLPSSATANRSLDMQLKNNYIKRRNNNRGVYMLTATPTVNSPIDAFNMLSQVVPPEYFASLGIVDGDDFIRMFGRTGEASVTKLSGDVETKEALLGFQNLDTLRSIFHKFVTVKEASDVDEEVHIPELVKQTSLVDMSPEQAAIYEELRERADALSNPDSDRAKEIAEQYPDDSVFGLIRKMDKACTDLDLYNGVITYNFDIADKEKVKALIADLPKTVSITKRKLNKEKGAYETKTINLAVNAEFGEGAEHCTLVIQDDLDSEVASRLEKFGIQRFSHPVSPKYAKFLELAKTVYLNGGKQLVFTEEKTQHVKLARIISQNVGCPMSEIGIINSDTVAGKKGAKATESDEEKGLEAIADAYNSGRQRFMILNKKGEVGVNLHHGTTDIHHLTLPFTPASITQRNGRGARVGSKAQKVNVHYYAGKGSFDQFRISTIERKARWMHDLFNGNDKMVDNGDASDAEDFAIMLAPDPEEAKRRIEANARKQKERMEAEYRRLANINISKYLKAVEDMNVDVDALKEKEAEKAKEFNRLAEQLEGEEPPYSSYMRDVEKSMLKARRELTAIRGQLKRIENARSEEKRYRPMVESAIKDGHTDASNDIFTNPQLYKAAGGRVVKIGGTYLADAKVSSWNESTFRGVFNIRHIDPEDRTVRGLLIQQDGYDGNIGRAYTIKIENIIGMADIDAEESNLIAQCREGFPVESVAQSMNREVWKRMITDGHLSTYSHNSNTVRIGLVERDGEFSLSYSPKDDIEHLVYPDLADKALIQRYLAYAVKYTSKTGSQLTLHGWSAIILGPEWEERIKEAGTQATPQDIAKHIDNIIKQIESENEDELKSALLGGSWKTRDFANKHAGSKLRGLHMDGFINGSEIRRAGITALNDYIAALEKRSEEAIQKASDLAFATFKAVQANSEGRRKRINEVWAIYQRYDASRSGRHIEKRIFELYGNDSMQIVADFDAAGLIAEVTDGSKLFGGNLKFEASRTATVGAGSIYSYSQFKEKMLAYLGSNKEPEPEITPKQQAMIEALAGNDVEDLAQALKPLGITVKTNSQPLVHQWKRRKTVFEPYKAICFYDESGKDGRLFKVKDALKSEFGAKFCNDASAEFPGCWWAVSAEHDINSLYDIFK